MNRNSIATILGILILQAELAFAQFQDQGFVNAVVRTDYNSQTEGTASNPITYVNPCLFTTANCGNSPTVFSATNSFSQNTTGYPQSSFWVLDFNNEPSYNVGGATTNNPGPPNQSIARSSPGFGLMGFTAFKDTPAGENFYRAHLVLNGNFTNPNSGGIPFVAIGSERYRGNNNIAPGTLNGSATAYKRVQFKARLWDFKLPTGVGTQPPTLTFYVYATTTWGGKARGLFITLAHWNFENSNSSGTFTKQYKWNWPMQESFYHPGVEWAFVDAEDIPYYCSGYSVPRLTTINQEISYDINLQTLFQCFSNWNGWETPMPTSTQLPIHAVHWSAEMTGVNGWIWPSVHDMKMAK